MTTHCGHLREDEIASAVHDAQQRIDPIGDQPIHQGINDGDSAGATGFKRHAGFMFSRQSKKFRSMLGQQPLIRRYERF